jgi:hypothetical protein
MNKQKGFANILIILLGLILIGGFFYFYKQNNTTTENSSITNEYPVENENKPSVSVGDRLGDMTVAQVRPFNENFSETEFDNFKINLSGPITITGTYNLVISEYGFSGYCMSDFDEESLAKLPSLSSDDKIDFFCFRNEEFVKAKLGENTEKIKTTVKIDNFEINRYPAGGIVDFADLIEVI